MATCWKHKDQSLFDSPRRARIDPDQPYSKVTTTMKIVTAAVGLVVACIATAQISSAIEQAHFKLRISNEAPDANVETKDAISIENANFVHTGNNNDDREHRGTVRASITLPPQSSAGHHLLRKCERTEDKSWASELEFACVTSAASTSNNFFYQLRNGSFFSSCFYDSGDDAGMDRVFQKAMHGAVLTADTYESVKCYSQQRATVSSELKDAFGSELNYVLVRFMNLPEDLVCY